MKRQIPSAIFIFCNFIALKEIGVRAVFVSVSLNVQRKRDISNNYRDQFRNYITLLCLFLFSFDLFRQIWSSLLIPPPGIFKITSEGPTTVKTNRLKQYIKKNNFTLQRILLYQMQWIQTLLKLYWQCHIILAVFSKSAISSILDYAIKILWHLHPNFFFLFLHSYYISLYL